MIRQHECYVNIPQCPLRVAFLNRPFEVAQRSLSAGLVDSSVMARKQQRATAKPIHPLRALKSQLPQVGQAGSRSAQLHEDRPELENGSFEDNPVASRYHRLDSAHTLRLRVAMILGTIGSLMITVGGWGAGAWPVVDNLGWKIGVVVFLNRMLHSSTVLVFFGIGLLVLAWLLMARFCVETRKRAAELIPLRVLWRTFGMWVLPLVFTAPLFTQDIYSYLAQGSIAARGWDPYTAGPVDILGAQDPLARSVPLMWSHSPSPYGPIAMGYSAVISWITQDNILWAVLLHRLVAICGLALASWALVRLARRSGVAPQTAMWLGVVNPLTILHLVGGIHNEALMLGMMLVGIEFVLRGVDSLPRPNLSRWILILAGLSIISAAGLIKVTAFLTLGFAGAAVAIWMGGKLTDLVKAAGISAAVAIVVSAGLSLITGVGFGWISSQGGAADIVSWMSISTVTGLASSSMGMLLGLGDHQDVALTVFRALGMLVGLAWVTRMLWATFKQRIHPTGGLGVAMFCLVIFFPVVHPWYLLWAIFPLAAWANRDFFVWLVAGYSVAFSFFILPKGLSLPPGTVLYIYVMFVIIFAAVVALAWTFIRTHPQLHVALRTGRSWEGTRLRALKVNRDRAVR